MHSDEKNTAFITTLRRMCLFMFPPCGREQKQKIKFFTTCCIFKLQKEGSLLQIRKLPSFIAEMHNCLHFPIHRLEVKRYLTIQSSVCLCKLWRVRRVFMHCIAMESVVISHWHGWGTGCDIECKNGIHLQTRRKWNNTTFLKPLCDEIIPNIKIRLYI